jgi:hypothetical protein
MVSSMVLGYPQATIVNWAVTYDQEGMSAGGSHLGKLPGIKKWLETLGPEHDDDIVIAADAYDVWFQLRPDVLIKRYLDINARAVERIRGELGEEAMAKYDIDQSILFSAQKKCGIKSFRDPFCDVVPQSTLPDDVFGPDTDVRQTNNQQNPDIFMRPRSLNSGTWTGKVKPLRKLFKEASKRAAEDPNWGSDQRILSSIFGEQESWRAALRDSQSRLRTQDAPDGKAMEFNMGIDYESSTGIPTVFSEDDLAWFAYNDTELIAEESKQVGLDPPKMPELIAADIASSRLPFADLDNDSPEGEALKQLPWDAVPLFTHLYTGVAPAMIHHNAWRDGRKNRRSQWWDRPFYATHLRNMLNGVSRGDRSAPLAVVTDEATGKKVSYEPIMTPGMMEVGLGAVSDKGEFLPWRELCDGFEEKIFLDKKGKWRDPR